MIHISYPADQYLEESFVLKWARDVALTYQVPFWPKDVNAAIRILRDFGRISLAKESNVI